jgi:hypothetical protein
MDGIEWLATPELRLPLTSDLLVSEFACAVRRVAVTAGRHRQRRFFPDNLALEPVAVAFSTAWRELERGRTSRTLRLDIVRLAPADDATEVTAVQVARSWPTSPRLAERHESVQPRCGDLV